MLAKFNAADLLPILVGLKQLSMQNEEQARQMLMQNEDLAYAVLEAELKMGIIQKETFSDVKKFGNLGEDQINFIKQVINVTDEQLALLPEEQREQVYKLREQYK